MITTPFISSLFRAIKRWKYHLAIISLLFLTVPSYFYFNWYVNEKISKIINSASSFLNEKTQSVVNVTDVSFNLFSSNLYIGNIDVLNNKNAVISLQDCKIKDVYKIYFSNEKNIFISCGESLFNGNNALPLIKKQLFSKNLSKEQNSNKISSKYSMNLVLDNLEININGLSKTASLSLNLNKENGKLRIIEKRKVNSSEKGFIEILFDRNLQKSDIRLDKIQLDIFEDFLKSISGLKEFSGISDGFITLNRLNNEITSTVDVSFQNLLINHPFFDTDPFQIPFFRFTGTINSDIKNKTLISKNTKLSIGGIEGSLTLNHENNSTDFSFDIEKVAINKLQTLVYNDLFKNYLFNGDINLFLYYEKEQDSPPLFEITGDVIEPEQLSERLDYLKEPFRYTVPEKDGQTLSFVVGEENEDFIPYDLLPDYLIWAVVISEDAGFFKHKGIDFAELSAAIKDNMSKKKMRGGSTITQQIAKNLFLNREKTLLRKFREVILSIELDAALSKKRLLEIYFNIIEWGPGIFGISQAAWYYFGKSAFSLTPLEAVYLATIIPGPNKYHHHFLNGYVSDKWIVSMERVLNIMNESGHLTIQQYIDAMKDNIVFREIEP